MDNQITDFYVLMLLLGSLHGFYLTAIALITARQKTGNCFLAILIFIFSYSLLNAVLYETGYVVHFSFLMGTAMPLRFMVGPAFWFYILLVLGERVRLRTLDFLHLLPAIIAILIALPYYLQPGFEKVAFVHAPTTTIPIERAWYFGAQLIITIIYLLFVYQKIKNQRKGQDWQWLKNINLALWILTIIYALFIPLIFTFDQYLVEIRSFFHLSISFFIHGIGFLILKESHIFAIWAPKRPVEELITSEQSEKLKKKILEYMENEKPWLNSTFSLKEMSDAVQSNSMYTSAVLNQVFEKSFTDFVNQYRIEHAKMLLQNSNQKLFAVALESGFANKNSFNRVFKKLVNATPSEYRARSGMKVGAE